MKRVDARGLTCPLPVIEAKKALRKMDEGQLEVVVDNIISLQNLEKMAEQTGLSYSTETGDDGYVIRIFAKTKKSRSSPLPALGKTVVVISSELMGGGDPDLGAILMKAFLFALSEQDQDPDKILLYNSGVKLAVEGSDSLADLQKMEKRGTEILSCGVCLDFYQLTEKVKVGRISNMYELVQSQTDAGRIIRL
ncbi:MAG: sulfurtransferase-like selenium metabolism protein YedF [Firmicutes bacterium]|nr:sulfurtransferase-like selenium metabolism protein YedF [Bacillota bacterium]